jgi:hypothetical protein
MEKVVRGSARNLTSGRDLKRRPNQVVPRRRADRRRINSAVNSFPAVLSFIRADLIQLQEKFKDQKATQYPEKDGDQ